MRMIKHAASLAIAGALLAGAMGQSSAAPVLSGSAALKSATPDAVVQVRWGRGSGWRGGFLAGAVIGGLAFGALAASPYDAYPAYGPYGYGPYPYADPYYGYGPCVTYEGYGRRRPCDGGQ